jgi:hypothetical protein
MKEPEGSSLLKAHATTSTAIDACGYKFSAVMMVEGRCSAYREDLSVHYIFQQVREHVPHVSNLSLVVHEEESRNICEELFWHFAVLRDGFDRDRQRRKVRYRVNRWVELLDNRSAA